MKRRFQVGRVEKAENVGLSGDISIPLTNFDKRVTLDMGVYEVLRLRTVCTEAAKARVAAMKSQIIYIEKALRDT